MTQVTASNQAVEDDSIVFFQHLSIDDNEIRYLFERKGKALLMTENGKEAGVPGNVECFIRRNDGATVDVKD